LNINHRISKDSPIGVTDLRQSMKNFQNIAENRIPDRVLCAGCVPESNSSMGNFCGQLQDAQAIFLIDIC
jgi:hypothetical protein